MKRGHWVILALCASVALLAFQAGSINNYLFTVLPKSDLSTTGELRFRDKQSTPHYAGFKAKDTIAANIVWRLPSTDAAGCLKSDGSLQLDFLPCIASAHAVSTVLACAAASASGTAYTCSTTPTFTPADGDMVLFEADVANTASATLAVNGASAATIKKQQGGANLVANDLLAGGHALMQFDGTNWQMEGQTGNASASAARHVINFGLDGGGAVIPTGDLGLYPSVDFNCTIDKAQISADVSSSVTVDIWKKAGGIPTSADKISASAPVTLASSQINQNSTRTSWTNSVSSGDVFGFNVATASTATKIMGQIWCTE